MTRERPPRLWQRGPARVEVPQEGERDMARNRIEQHPENYREDLNPHYKEGENEGPPRYETVTADQIKDLYDLYPHLRDDELKQIPVLVTGSRLEQGATYFD